MIRSLSARLESTPLAVRETRRFVRDILRVWDAEILAEVAELLAGELVTNAVLYAETPIDVNMAWSDGDAPRLRVKVCDEADTMPQVVEPPRPSGQGGYGLRLLAGSRTTGGSNGATANVSGSRWAEAPTGRYWVSGTTVSAGYDRTR